MPDWIVPVLVVVVVLVCFGISRLDPGERPSSGHRREFPASNRDAIDQTTDDA